MNPAAVTPAALIASGRRTLAVEARAVADLQIRIDERFVRACRLCLATTGRVVVTGLGKSGHIGNKIAATLASTGTPSFFLHAAEASHGDLGMVARGDVVIAISNSGETAELLSLLPHLRRLGTPLIALTGRPASTLAREADVNLDVSVEQEACPLNLAPTASTTATLAMGDALATALLEARGFTEQDFALSHPGGALGRKLLLHVEDVMRRSSQLPRVGPNVPLAQGLIEMSLKGLGLTAVVDANDKLLGVFTDGDLRRTLDRNLDLRATPIEAVMTRDPRVIAPRALAADAVNLMQQHQVTALLVTDDERHLVGALNIHDLLRAGVV
ncbi:MAG: KpsF/GutQ family sugar-phosphate isomerase [Nevskiaceae bacterium]|jgi:arabinose-5-phosphate isomerase|nr:KpsF/GutQ family sugar-phosphate isomerase [Nevskiaceae bacterium]